jgi:hypothetical protein
VSVGECAIDVPVIAMQIRVSNEGTDAIRPQQILETPSIALDNKTGTILEARVLSTSRPITAFSVNSSPTSPISLSWRILEPDDYAVIQVIYAGASNAPVRVNGVIEGQRQIGEAAYAARPLRAIALVIGAFLGIVILAFGVVLSLSTVRSLIGERRQEIIFLTVVVTSAISVCVFVIFRRAFLE